ncbi:MAG: hypothetical protein CBC00_02765 [Verrucomicrobia bacterium TMED40]|nr:MAG: hypothetical protein CBC00_02765 [Verrucomicrobia bacterium TMED40]
MSFISPVLSSKHQINQSIRRREITKSVDQISSGNRFASDTGKDSAALRISTKFASQIKTAKTTKRNIENAYQLTQYQADILRFAEQTIKRMNELSYEATDIMVSDVDRRSLNNEFKSHVESLEQLLYDRSFGDGKIMFDPLQSTNINALEVEGESGGPETFTDVNKNFGSLGGKIKLWWQPFTYTDRLRLFQGDRWFFDTGEYSSTVGGNTRPHDGTYKSDGVTEVKGDYFEIDFEPGKTTVSPASDNVGDADNQTNFWDTNGDSMADRLYDFPIDSTFGYSNGYKTRETIGNTSVFTVEVNGEQVLQTADLFDTSLNFGPDGINDINPRMLPTAWNLFMRIDKNYIDGPQGIKNELGETMELPTVGFSTLEAYDLSSRTNAIEAMEQTQLELNSLQAQIGNLATTYSNLRFNSQRAESRGISYQTTHGVITDSDMASQATKLAKNLIAQEATESAMVHSRISAENVFNLIL